MRKIIMMTSDLNKAIIECDWPGRSSIPLQDFSVEVENGQTAVYFRDIESHLLEHIAEADIIVGCVAWLTSMPILEALALKDGVSIIVQKEDFLRPDLDVNKNWKPRFRESYNKLPSTLMRYHDGFIDTPFHSLSVQCDPTIEAIRCIGNSNVDKTPAFPRAHHKFVVFCRKIDENLSEIGGNFTPYAVWTGSFNFTKNAGRSLENAIVLKNKDIVTAYFNEYVQIACLSESLDWESVWSTPEWRIGS
jgi:hypothetical protein